MLAAALLAAATAVPAATTPPQYRVTSERTNFGQPVVATRLHMPASVNGNPIITASSVRNPNAAPMGSSVGGKTVAAPKQNEQALGFFDRTRIGRREGREDER